MLWASDLSAMRKEEGKSMGWGVGGRKWGRGCSLEFWEPAGGSQTQALSSVGRWEDGARVTGVGTLV